MYASPMPLEQPPMVDRPGVRALRGARPQMTPEMQRMRDWANSQRTATAANARNGDFILSQGPDGPPAGVSLPTQLSTGDYTPGGPSGLFGDWRSAAPSRPGPNGPGGPNDVERLPPPPEVGKPMPPVKPGMLPNKPMEAPPPDKRGRLTGRRG